MRAIHSRFGAILGLACLVAPSSVPAYDINDCRDDDENCKKYCAVAGDAEKCQIYFEGFSAAAEVAMNASQCFPAGLGNVTTILTPPTSVLTVPDGYEMDQNIEIEAPQRQ